MRIKVHEEGQGLHPNEVVVSIPTLSGEERLVVHRRSLSGGFLEIGYPISQDADSYLIELPRETMTGLWRVRIKQSNLFESKERQFA